MRDSYTIRSAPVRRDKGAVPPVATVIEPEARVEVDRAGAGLYRAVHRESVGQILRDLRERRVSAVLLSASRCLASELPQATRVVREFPRIPAVVLVSRHGRTTPSDLLALGNCGVQHLIDVRTSSGWRELREALITSSARERDDRDLRDLMNDVTGASTDLVQFLQALFSGYTGLRTVRELAETLGVLPSTMVSRFYRAGLPAPKRYLALAGLVRAARLLENPGLSIADVANHLNHSSPQSFARHVRTYLRMPAGDFRRRCTGAVMMRRFRDELVVPYRDRLCRLSPVITRPRCTRGLATFH